MIDLAELFPPLAIPGHLVKAEMRFLRIWGSGVRISPSAPICMFVGNVLDILLEMVIRTPFSRAFLFLAMRDARLSDPTACLDRRNNVVAERRLDA